jgi:hypothetical protein
MKNPMILWILDPKSTRKKLVVVKDHENIIEFFYDRYKSLFWPQDLSTGPFCVIITHTNALSLSLLSLSSNPSTIDHHHDVHELANHKSYTHSPFTIPNTSPYLAATPATAMAKPSQPRHT